MIPASDLWMLGLRAVRGVAPSGAAQPLRDIGQLFPSWAARLHRRLTGRRAREETPDGNS
jgi:hypothetical protein